MYRSENAPRASMALWRFLYPQVHVRNNRTGWNGKSNLSLVEAVSMAIGRDLLAGNNEIPKRNVWYMNLEDPLEEVER